MPLSMNDLRAKFDAKKTEAEALIALGDAREDDAGLTDDEVGQLTAINTEVAETRAAIDKKQAGLDQIAMARSHGALPPATEPGRPASILVGDGTKEKLAKDPTHGFADGREYVTAVIRAGAGLDAPDKRLIWDDGTGRGQYQATAGSDEQSVGNSAYGGFLVPSVFIPNLLAVGVETDPTLGRTTDIPMASNMVEIPAMTDKDHSSSVSGGIQVYRTAETQAPTTSRFVTEKVTLTSKALAALVYASNDLLQDSAISITPLIERAFRTEIASKILTEKLTGTGTTQMQGVVGAACTIDVTKETNQVAATVSYENIVKMYARCWRPAGAIWLVNNSVLPQLMTMTLAVGTGGIPMWQTSAVEGAAGTILGLPVFPTEYTKAVGTSGDIILGNWGEYLVGQRAGADLQQSVHVRFVNNETAFRVIMRNDGKPWWRSALTPVNGSTLSPFVTLATRS